MKKQQSELLDRYLAGDAPQHPERLMVPTEDELNEAEAAFDRLMAERQSAPAKKARMRRLWPWAAAAACLLIVFGLGLTWPDRQPAQPAAAIAKTENSTDKIVKPEVRKDTVAAPAAPAEPKAIPASPSRHRLAKHYLAKTQRTIPDTLGSDLWESERNVMLALQMLSECGEAIQRGEQATRNLVVEAEYRSAKSPFNETDAQPLIELVANEYGDYHIVAANQENIIDI